MSLIQKLLLEEGYLERLISGAATQVMHVHGTITPKTKSHFITATAGQLRGLLQQKAEESEPTDEVQVANLLTIAELRKQVAYLNEKNSQLAKTVKHWREQAENK